MNVKPLLAGLIVTLLMPLVAQEAEACSASCFPGAFLPSNSDVPASIPGIYWVASRGFLTPVSPFDVGLTQITATGEMPVDVTAQTISDGLVYVLVPVAPLVPNTDYVIRDSKVCEDGGLMAETMFHTTDAAPLPTKLGTLKVGFTTEGPVEVATRDGSCSTYVNGVSSSLELELDPEAAPYANAFDYETLVDEMPWHPTHSLIQRILPGENWQGRGKDLVYAHCGSGGQPGDTTPLSEGTHSVVFRAKLHGSEVIVESAPAIVTLQCANVEDPPPTTPPVESCSVSVNATRRSIPPYIVVPFASLLVALRMRRKSSRKRA